MLCNKNQVNHGRVAQNQSPTKNAKRNVVWLHFGHFLDPFKQMLRAQNTCAVSLKNVVGEVLFVEWNFNRSCAPQGIPKP